jgi:hypothetical protein
VIGGGALDEAKALADLGVSRAMIPPLAFDPAGIRRRADALRRRGHLEGLRIAAPAALGPRDASAASADRDGAVNG